MTSCFFIWHLKSYPASSVSYPLGLLLGTLLSLEDIPGKFFHKLRRNQLFHCIFCSEVFYRQSHTGSFQGVPISLKKKWHTFRNWRKNPKCKSFRNHIDAFHHFVKQGNSLINILCTTEPALCIVS